MHFTKTLTTFLLSAALTSVVTSSPLQRKVFRREDLDDDIEADDDVWERLGDLCGSQSSKRALEARGGPLPPGHIEVGVGKNEITDVPLGLWTSGLVSCIGVAVTGKKKDSDTKVRALGHIIASKMTMEDQWSSFKAKVEAANIEDIKGWLSVPDKDDDTPDGYDDDMRELAEEIESELKDRMDKLVEEDAKKVKHPMQPALDGKDQYGVMSVNPDNVVYVDGKAES